MINQNNQNENTKNEVSYAIKELGIGKLLRKSNITKNCGIPAFDCLTKPNRIKAFVLDDSVVKRNRSKKVELLARVYNHVEHKFQRGFSMLTLGWI